ncbi:hypothetical protein Pla52n_56750 [Stieleria varia]|uniref:Uncharacterized protein n=1 Tax=Stieleria varia TaxID=2528005 RepID=A0A5C6A3D4_9BACT|nr:hypothetical protein Pla52n_56750 [Stieleria varia]
MLGISRLGETRLRALSSLDWAVQNSGLCLYGFAQIHVPTAGAAGEPSEPQALAVGLWLPAQLLAPVSLRR